MQIFVQSQSLHTVSVDEDTTVLDVKRHVADVEGISVDDQLLTFAGCPLGDEQTLGDCQVAELSTLAISARLFGGRSHIFCWWAISVEL